MPSWMEPMAPFPKVHLVVGIKTLCGQEITHYWVATAEPSLIGQVCGSCRRNHEFMLWREQLAKLAAKGRQKEIEHV